MSVALVEQVWRQYVCRACGLVYDEARGDPDGGLAPGTRFADIPDDWACPICGVTKADFEPYDDVPLLRRSAHSAGSAFGAGGQRGDPGVVIVGAGRAGWQMAEALRQRDGDLPITIISACDAAVYDKPQLSVALHKRLSMDAFAKESAVDAARRLGIRLLAATQALRIDTRASRLRTSRGSLRFRHLVLAHGASPRSLPQLPAALCWRINHLDAYRRFRAVLAVSGEHGDGAAHRSMSSVIIVGAGLVGCELANDLALAGHPVTLLDVEARPLVAVLDAERSQRLLEAWRTLPLQFEGGVRVTAVERVDERQLVVASADGRRFSGAQVVAATGLETPSRLAESAGLAWRNGIAVDAETLATNIATVHALGDCISIDGKASRYIEPIARQARVIADRVTGRVPARYAATSVPIRIKTSSLPLTA